MKLSQYEKGFVEAFIDTDGSIYLSKVKRIRGKGYTPKIALDFSNNSIKILEKIKEILNQEHRKLTLKKGSKNYKISFRHGIIRKLFPQIRLVIKEDKRKKSLEILKHLENAAIGGRGKINTLEYQEKMDKLVEDFLSL